MNKEQMILKIKNYAISSDFLNSLSDDLILQIFNQTVDYSKLSKINILQATIDKAQSQINEINASVKVDAIKG